MEYNVCIHQKNTGAHVDNYKNNAFHSQQVQKGKKEGKIPVIVGICPTQLMKMIYVSGGESNLPGFDRRNHSKLEWAQQQSLPCSPVLSSIWDRLDPQPLSTAINVNLPPN